jgi:iron complex transport system ATP-binding protein
MSEPLLTLEHLTLRVPGRTLVAGLSLTIRSGERWAVLGPNGAGKSTLLRVLAGARRADEGVVRVGADSIAALSALELARLRALVTDRWIDTFSSTVVDTVLTARYVFGDRDIEGERLAHELLAKLDCDHLADHDVRGLSRGERQRVAIATALAQQTPVLLLDEPTAHQDPRHQVGVLEVLRELPQRALVASLHDVNAAARYATHALLLSGRGSYRAGTAIDVLQTDALSDLFETVITAIEADGERIFRVQSARR